MIHSTLNNLWIQFTTHVKNNNLYRAASHEYENIELLVVIVNVKLNDHYRISGADAVGDITQSQSLMVKLEQHRVD